MYASVESGLLLGLHLQSIKVEASISPGLPSFQIVGLPSSAVSESRARVKAALSNSGFPFPKRRVTINLAPAELRKESPLLDLPIALSIVLATHPQLKPELEDTITFGELSLNGEIRSSPMSTALTLGAQTGGYHTAYVPIADSAQAARVPRINVFGFGHLSDLVRHLKGQVRVHKAAPANTPTMNTSPLDFLDVHGQTLAKRVLLIAAAGRHNVLMSGPPGVGKSMLAARLPTILPALTASESLEVSCLYRVAKSVVERGPSDTSPPFRSPHYSISRAGLIGGGNPPTFGEISLAHRGVLFLDEFLEFPISLIETLRTPMEDGAIRLARAGARVELPCRFQLIAAHNPCPCGYWRHRSIACECQPAKLLRYREKLSGPIVDRFDLGIRLTSEPFETKPTSAQSSAELRKKVSEAHCFKVDLKQRGGARLAPSALRWLNARATSGAYSRRRRASIMRIAATIATLELSAEVCEIHLEEALLIQPQTDRRERFS